MKQKKDAKELQQNLPTSLQCSMELLQEKGASTWLTALPVEEYGFALHKAAFRDTLSLRYGWPLQNSPSHCSCGQSFSVEHALTCKTWGFPAVRYNEVKEITATLLTEVEWQLNPTYNRCPESPCLIAQPLLKTVLNSTSGFWGERFEKALRVFNRSAQSNHHASLSSVYCKHEQENRRQYDVWSWMCNLHTFSAIHNRWNGTCCNILQETRINDCREKRWLNWIQCRLSFALLRASIMSIRGVRSSRHHWVSNCSSACGKPSQLTRLTSL